MGVEEGRGVGEEMGRNGLSEEVWPVKVIQYMLIIILL